MNIVGLCSVLLGGCLAALGCVGSDARSPLSTIEWPEDSGFVTAGDGVRLFYRTIGSGPLNVVIPVDFYLKDAFRPLASAERRLVFYDPRARGRSDPGSRSHVTLDRQIADVEVVRLGLGIDSMMLIGWSGLAMEMAVYTIRNPERVIGLVQVAPVAARDRPHNPRAYETRALRTDTLAFAALQDRHRVGEFANEPAAYCRALWQVMGPANFSDSAFMSRVPDVCTFPNEHPDSLAPVFRALLGSFAGYDWREAIARTPVRRLVIHGAQDAFPLEGSCEWVPPGSNARLLVIDRAGHFPFLERPDEFLPAVDAFLLGRWPDQLQRSAEARPCRVLP